jgi:asparagine synthase (glutamine-hydrolysing)
MWSGHSQAVGVLNGEIYNVKELRHLLELRGHEFRGTSDTEVVLNAYEQWGASCLPRLRGMFALAILDLRDGRVQLARDALGIKPLYYLMTSNTLAFASEVQALVVTGLADARVSEIGVESFLETGAVAEPETLIEGVRMLPPGTWLSWDGLAGEIHRYWDLQRAFERPHDSSSWNETCRELRHVLERAVRRHLISDVPLGVFLSGGVDSTAIVGLASGVSNPPPQTISVDFAERGYGEGKYMDLVASRFGTSHQQVRLSQADLIARLPAALSAMDQPTIDGINTYVVAGVARGAGLTVALSGLGADELFGGYGTFRLSAAAAFARTLPKPIRSGAAWTISRVLGATDSTAKVAQWLASDSPPAPEVVFRELFSVGSRHRLLRARPSTLRRPTGRPSQLDAFNRVSLSELRTYMLNTLLRDTDVFSMAHGLEVRVPFLDREVVEYVARLPGHLKAGRGPKSLLVGSLTDILPSEVIRRRKMGFSLPLEHWMRDSLRDDIDDALRDSSFGGPLASLLDPDAVGDTWKAFQAGRVGWARAWSLYVLKSWGQRLLDRQTTHSSTQFAQGHQ